MNHFQHLSKLLLVLFVCLIGFQSLAQCNANAGPNRTKCAGAPVSLGGGTPASGNAPFTYSWSPATDLSCTNCPNPICTATVNTTYTLTITDDDGCTDSDNVNVIISGGPVANFTFAPNNACANLPVQFTSTSTGSGLTYDWDFGNPASGGSNSSSQQNPIHEFISTGTGTQTFPVTLTVTNASGCVSSITQNVTVSQTPAPLLIDPITLFKNCDGSNFNITVYDGTPNPGTNYTIVWGDGSPNFTGSPFPGSGVSHLYSTSDIFDLLYIVEGTNGCADTMTQLVSNITNPAIGAANPGATTGCGPMTLCFPLSNYATNHSSTTYEVNYGDGSPIVILPHPPPAVICHTYTTSSCGQPGNAFTFIMKAVNSCDSSLASISPIRVYGGPQANFTASPSTQCVNTPITFLNTSVLGFNSSCTASTVFNWNFGDGQTLTTVTLTNPVHVYTLPGTYTVTLSTTNSCGTTTLSQNVCIEVPPAPNFTITPAIACVPFNAVVTNLSPSINSCNTTSVWSVIFNGSTCLPSAGTWNFINSTNATSLNPEFEFIGPGQYTVRLTMTNSCGTFIYDQIVIGQAPPQITLASLPTICAGESVNPSAVVNDCYEPADSYSWTFTGGLPSNSSLLIPGSVQYVNAGTFNVQLVVVNLCGSVSATTPVVVNSPPIANAGPDIAFCSGGSGVLGSPPVGGVTYAWSPTLGLSSSTIANPSITLTNATALPIVNQYVVTASSSPTCFTRDTVLVTVNPIPVLIVNSPTICIGASTPLNVSGAGVGGNYSWSPATALSCTNCFDPTANPVTTTTYTISGTSALGCISTVNSTVTVNPLPIVVAGPDLSLCDQPIPVTLNGTPAGGVWSGSPNVSAGGIFTPNGVEVVTLTYTYTDPSTLCVNSDDLVVTVDPAVIPTIDPIYTLCANDASINLTVSLNANPTGGIWSGTGVTNPNFNPAVAGVGTHTVTYTFGTGTCLTTASSDITVNPVPTISVNSETICNGENISLVASGAGIGGDYNWSPATALSCTNCFDPTANPTSTIVYTVSGTTSLGCINSAVSTVTVNPLPIVNAGPDLVLCDQPIPATINGTPIGGTWTGSVNVTSAGVFTPNGPEVSTLYYTYVDPTTLCVNVDSMIVTVSAPIIPSIDPIFSICANSPVINLSTTLNANPLGGSWSGAGVTTPNFNPAVAGVGTHTLTYTYGSGTCLTTATSDITVNPTPIILASSGTICVGETVAISASGAGPGGTYNWTPATDLSCANCFDPNANPSSTTIYTVTGTTVFGCINSTSSTVTVNPLPIVNAGPDMTLCDQPIPVTLTGTPIGGVWTGSVNVSGAGVFSPNGSEISTLYYTYSIPLTGCTSVDSMLITVVPPVIPTIDPTYSICVNEPLVDLNLVLNPSQLGGTWSGTGVTNPTFNPTTAGVGTHIVSYTYGAGTCLNVVTSAITVNPQPTISVNSGVICDGQSINLIASGAGAGGNYNWSPTTALSCTNCFDPTANPTATIVYSVSGTTVFGCINTVTSTVTVNPLPIVNAGVDTILCDLPSSVQLFGTPAGGVWSGTNINASGLFTPAGTGSFPVDYTFTLATGCTATDTRIIQVVAPQIADAGLDLEFCIDAPAVSLSGLPAGGTWSGTNITSAGIYTITNAGTFQMTYSIGAGNCFTSDVMDLTIHPLPTVVVGPDVDFCFSDAATNFTANLSGGTWTGTGISDAVNGTFDPSIAGVGLHTIVYTYTDPITTCVNSDTLIVDVHPLPVVSFTFNPIVCTGTPELFNSTSTFLNTTVWDFGDGNSSVVNSPSNTYATIGTYNVQAIVTSPFGCIDSLTQSIEVREPPVADFTLAPDSACGPLTVSFNNQSTGLGMTYAWDFGNGQTSVQQNPADMTYFASNIADTTYYVVLDVTNMCGTVSHTETVVVMPSPTAIFGPDFDSGCSPFTANFASTSLGLPDSYYWDFGNGVTSSTTDSLFQQTFTTGATPTDYTIMLVVFNECGQDTAYHTITALPNTVNAFFNTSATTSCFDLTVNFTQYTLGGTLYSWDFGDGTTSSQYSPSHVYANPGTYTVSLFANDGCSYDTTAVTITVNEPPVVGFSVTPDSTCVNVPFDFTNLSQGAVSSVWDFGDGTTSNLTNPSHAYIASGDYTVTLTGTDLFNGCTATVTQTVHISTNPIAQFLATPTNGCVPLTVQFTNQSTNATYQTWDFGNGNTSALMNPSFTFTAPGVYTVQLIAENVNGCADTVNQNITVYSLPVAAFTTSYNCTDPVTINFTNQTTGAISYSWDFGNGQSSSLTNPTETFTTPGNYTVQLTASNQYGCEHVYEEVITIYPLPTLTISANSVAECANVPITFSSLSSNVDSIVWNMGDGTFISDTDFDYTYSANGNYSVSAIAYGSAGCIIQAFAQGSITIYPAVLADFDYLNVQNSTSDNGTIVFDNLSINADTYYWDFGGGAGSTEMNPSYTFGAAGSYSTTLIAANQYGCIDTAIMNVDVIFLNGLFLANAMYPGHSNYEVSHFVPKGVNLKEFELLIYDDWGNLIWSTTALDANGRPTEAWDGTYNGEPVQQDAYVWKVTAVFRDDAIWEGKEYGNKRFKKAGTVTVIR